MPRRRAAWSENTASTPIGGCRRGVIGQFDRVIGNPAPCTQSGLEQAGPTLFPAGATSKSSLAGQ